MACFSKIPEPDLMQKYVSCNCVYKVLVTVSGLMM